MAKKKAAGAKPAQKTPQKNGPSAKSPQKTVRAKKTAAKPAQSASNPSKVGRPSNFTDEVKAKILTAIAAGNSLTTSAQYANITYETLRVWLKKGESGEGEYSVFSVAIKKGQADAEALSVGRIRQAAKGGAVIERTTVTTERTTKSGSTVTTTRATERYAPPQWQADAWWLERVNRQQWGRHDRVTNTNYNFDLERLTDEQFELFDQLTDQGVEPPIAYATCLNQKEGA